LVFLARDDPQSLVVLLNEEIVVIDLVTDTWPSYHLPYLNSIHASPVICTTFACDVNRDFFQKLTNYASVQFEDYSDRVCLMNFILNFNLRFEIF
jgi:lethal(2) giant larvae protein